MILCIEKFRLHKKLFELTNELSKVAGLNILYRNLLCFYTLKINWQKGIKNAERIRIAEQGKAGKNGGKNGDLYIKVNMMKDNRYTLQGDDIYMDLAISPWEAAFGCKVNVKGIDSTIVINIPEGIQSGEKLKVANNGFWNGNKC